MASTKTSAEDLEVGGDYSSKTTGTSTEAPREFKPNSLTDRFKQHAVSPTQNEDNDASKSQHRSSSNGLTAVTTCLVYSFCSISMILVNKSLASSYNSLITPPPGIDKQNLNTLLVVFQAAAAVLFLRGCKIFKLLDFPELQWSTVQAWAPVNVFFCLMLFTSMAALQTNSVPMVTVFKNVANITTATADYFIFGNILEPLSIAAFVVMFLGAVAASWNDMESSMSGLFWMLFNCFTTTGYVCYMRYATQTIKMSKFGMVYVNNVLCVLFLVPVAWANGEIHVFFASTQLHTWDYGFKNLFAGFVGFFLNAASLHCVSVTGPTTYAIVGSLNKVPVTFLGYILFKEKLSPKSWFFVMISLIGGFLYTFAKIRAQNESNKLAAENKKQLARGASVMPQEPEKFIPK
eukprot:CAMPEP_0198144466 /NCGR_PEP_ID=MMETSP1443-20131203/16131_1 /TAXON_ID=186043 /ORGANISM="Entomoneis sp., Strain CCMP2396" /LENGTH=404 /DNA_ID=CAMNT_0043807869 /DNA_START=125 /DNA_END=1339 /DNA_ORIENTATION=+